MSCSSLSPKRRNKKGRGGRKRKGEELRMQKAWDSQNGLLGWERSLLEQEGEKLKWQGRDVSALLGTSFMIEPCPPK